MPSYGQAHAATFTAKAATGVALFTAPFLIAFLTPTLGTRRGVWVTMAGVLITLILERPLRPFFLSQREWIQRSHWLHRAIVLGVLAGLLASVGDAFARDASLRAVVAQLWIPLYRSMLFVVGLTILRRVWNERQVQESNRASANVSPFAAPVHSNGANAVTASVGGMKTSHAHWGCSRCLAVSAARVRQMRRRRTEMGTDASPSAPTRGPVHHPKRRTVHGLQAVPDRASHSSIHSSPRGL